MWANVWYYLATQLIVLAASFGLSLCFESPFIRLEKLWIGALLQAFLPQKERNGKVKGYQTAKTLDDTIEMMEKEKLEQRYTNGTMEQSDANGTLEQRYANRTMEKRYDNGTMEQIYANGTIEQRYANETMEQRYANGTMEQRYANGTNEQIYPNGTMELRYANRTTEQRYANETMEQRYANGTMDGLGIEKKGFAREDKINEKLNHSKEEKNNLEVTNTTKQDYFVEATKEILARSSNEQCITIQSSAIDEEDRGVFGLAPAEVCVEISPTYQETQKNHTK
jgi:hypothetical protein